MQVTKSSGITELYDESKIYKVVSWACRDTKINPKQIIAEIQDHLQDGMSTSDIQAAVVKVAADKITIEQPDFQYVAARLKMFGLRKHVYGCFTPDSFYTHIVKNTKRGVYDKEILEKWSKEEIAELDKHIDHDKDMDFSYAGAMQVIEKYLVKDRSTGEIFETPQFAYMLIGMCLNQEENDKVTIAKKAYDKFASRKLSLPTPIMGGVRTPTRQFSSCVLVDAGDSLDGIADSSKAIMKYIAKRAGIGVNGGRIRAEGSRIRSGEVKHTGVIPFWKHIQTAVKSCSQGL